MKKNMKGITLVSLVITIIVMLILAGVSISMATGNNGVLTRGQEGAVNTKLGSIESDIGLALNGVQTDFFAEFAGSTSKVGNKNAYLTLKRLNDQLNECFLLANSANSGADKLNVKISNTNAVSADNNGSLTKICSITDGKSSTTSSATGYVSSVGYVCNFLYFSNGTSATSMGGDLYIALVHFDEGFFVVDDVGIAQATPSTQKTLNQGAAATATTLDGLDVKWLNSKL